MEINEQIGALNKDIQESLKKIEEGAATKVALQKLEEQFKALQKSQDRQHIENKTDRVFGTKAAAQDFMQVLKGAINRSYLVNEGLLNKESPWYVNKADLNSYGTGNGLETVPTATSNVLSMLLLQSSLMRKEATVYDNLQGNLVLTKRNGTSSVLFTANSGLKDDATVTAASFGTASVTLSPKQLCGLSYVSEKLLYVSAIPVAENVAIDLTEQAGYRENYVSYKADGTADDTNGSITGLKTASGINVVSANAATFASDPIEFCALAVAAVDQSVYADPNSKFYMAPNTMAAIRESKASTSGVYHYDPAAGDIKLLGYSVQPWHVMDTPSLDAYATPTFTVGKVPVIFGNIRKAAVLGIGRDMSIEVSRDYRWANNQAAFRLTYDMDFKVLQGGALTRITAA